MKELRTDSGTLVGKYGFTRKGFLFEYKHHKGMVTIFLPLFPKVGTPDIRANWA